MTSFLLVFAVAGVLLLVAMAPVTVASTTAFEENHHGISGSETDCAQRVIDEESLSDCQLYVMHTYGQRFENLEEDKLYCCCQELKNLGKKCLCPKEYGDLIISISQNLPITCKLSSQKHAK